MTDSKREARILTSNISTLKRRVDISNEQMEITLRQLSRLAFREQADKDIKHVYDSFCRMAGDATAEQKVMFCRYVCEEMRGDAIAAVTGFFGEGEAALPGTHGKVAYVRNKRGDDAFLSLSEGRRGYKPYYVSTFSEACEAVLGNISEFCLLPIENNTDGRLYSFYSMLDRYELKICGLIKVDDDNEIDYTYFALVGRGADITSKKNVSQRFEFSVIEGDADFIGDIIRVAKMLGGSLYSVGTQPLPYDDLRNKYYFAVDFSEASPLPMALYVGMEYLRCVPIGIYERKI